MFENIINETIKKFENKTPNNEDIINSLFDNEELKIMQTNEIRRTTIIGKLANEIFLKLNLSYNCKIMAIGDIEYFGEFKIKWEKLVKESLSNINENKLHFYDLSSQGTLEFREKLFEYMNLYYNFPNLKTKILNEIIPSYSTTDGLTIIFDTIRHKFYNQKINFIFPEASFSATINNADYFGFKTIKINKPSIDNFFIYKTQIQDLYKEINNENNIFYFTTVGNPTGEKLNSNDLFEIIEYICKKDTNAIILLDNVYVGLLKKSYSIEMFEKIFTRNDLLNQIIFCESLSKTLGTTGIRIGFFWTLNSELSQLLKRNIILKKAGFSKILAEFSINLLSNIKEIEEFQNEVYDFISNQRKNFLTYIKINFSEFFDFENSPKIIDREGIFILLKLQNLYSAKKIFAITGIIGVEIRLSDGVYIRYGFGNTNYFSF